MEKILKNAHFVASYSGGKDSVLAIHRALKAGMILDELLITYNVKENRSWFHGIPKEVLEEVSASIGVPVNLIFTSGTDYNEQFDKALIKAREEGATACVFGDIDIEEHLSWGEDRCKKNGLTACYPLLKESRRALVRETIQSGYKPVITVIDTEKLDLSFLGKELDMETVSLMEKQGMDACGENGEYHSFVTSGPIFREPLKVHLEKPLVLGRYAVCPIVKA